MSDPHVREIDRLTDPAGREVIIGVNYDAVTVRTVHPADEAVELGCSQMEELAQLVVSAAWQAGWQTGAEHDDDTGGAP